MIDALLYNRFRWIGDTSEIGDIERILTWTGVTAPVTINGVRTLRPLALTTKYSLPYQPVRACPFDTNETLDYPWGSLFMVAPARRFQQELEALLSSLNVTLNTNVVTSRTTKYIKTADATQPAIQAIATGQNAGIPILEVGSSLSADDIISVGDGDIKAQSIRDAWNVTLSTYAQMLGVHTNDVVKKERALVDELESVSKITEIVRANEIEVRTRVAEWLGLEFRPVL